MYGGGGGGGGGGMGGMPPQNDGGYQQNNNANPQTLGDFQVYIGNLDQNVNNSYLLSVFQKKYHSVYEAKIIIDPLTKNSKGFGFLRFGIREQAQNAIDTMQSHVIMSRAIKLGYAAQKREPGDNQNRNQPPPSTFQNTTFNQNGPQGYPNSQNMNQGSMYGN